VFTFRGLSAPIEGVWLEVGRGLIRLLEGGTTEGIMAAIPGHRVIVYLQENKTTDFYFPSLAEWGLSVSLLRIARPSARARNAVSSTVAAHTLRHD
jgi:hypothetical protein